MPWGRSAQRTMTVVKVYSVAPVASARAPSTIATAWTDDLLIGPAAVPEALAMASASTPDSRDCCRGQMRRPQGAQQRRRQRAFGLRCLRDGRRPLTAPVDRSLAP